MFNLIEKTQAQKDVDEINESVRPMIYNVIAAIAALNDSRKNFWSFSTERLNAMFSEIGPEKLQGLFANHLSSAELLNQLAIKCGIESRAEIGAMRELEIIDGNIRVVEPEPPVPEPPVPAEE